MEHPTEDRVPVIDAVTVLLLRDAPDGSDPATGPEVLLLERHTDSPFAPGALVFPGGKIDDVDRGLDPGRRRCADPAAWAERLGVADEDAAIAMLVAAVRETFEEAGVLLAGRRDGTPLTDAPLPARELATTRKAMAARDVDLDWRPWLEEHDLVLDLDALSMWSWWVTPEGRPRRFDTRFLVAALPAGQIASPDEVEITAMRWLSPIDALASQQRGEATIIFPTRCTLEQLAAHPDRRSALAAARRGDVDLRRIQPTSMIIDGVRMILHPDADAPVPA